MKFSSIKHNIFPSSFRPIPYVAFLVNLGLSICKAFYLGKSLLPNQSSLGGFVVFVNDIPFLGCIAFFTLALSVFQYLLLRCFCYVLIYFGTLWYLIDVIIISRLNARVGIGEIIHYAQEAGEIDEIRTLALFALSIFLVSLYALRFTYQIRNTVYALFFSFCMMLVPSLSAIPGFKMYETPIFIGRKNHNIVGRFPPKFTEDELIALNAKKPLFDVHSVDQSRRNVILLVIESLTSSDSYLVSGLQNALPKFDKLAAEGTLFTNFFANYSNSEGGIVSLMNGIPPMQYPNGYWTQFRSYEIQDSITKTYQDNGYDTMFISSATLKFRGKNEYVKNLGVQDIYGLENVPEFNSMPKFVFGAVTDEILYKKSLSIIDDKKDKPFLFLIETTSSHLPYTDPLKRADTEQNVWSYVDDQLELFVQELQKSSFFSNGVLLVTGDHRKMLPIPEKELKRYGESAQARIPLLAIGAGIPKNVIDKRYFQQSDLLSHLSFLSDPTYPLSPYVTYVTQSVIPLIGRNPEVSIIFEKKSENTPTFFETFGKNFEWLADKPYNSSLVETDRKRILARLQYCAQKADTHDACGSKS